MQLQTLINIVNEEFYDDSSSYKTIQSKSNELLTLLKPTLNIKKITSKTITEYVKILKQKGNSKSTINSKLSYLSKLLTYAIQKDLITHKPFIPFAKIKSKKDRFLTRSERAQMYIYCRHKNLKELLWVVRIGYHTGRRISEILNIDSKKDIDNGYWRIWSNKEDKPFSIPLAKLTKMFSNNHIKFTSNYQQIYYQFKQMTKELNLKQVTLHTLRHTTASTLVQKGVPIYSIKEYMNHSSIQTTQLYTHLSNKNLEETAMLL